MKRTMIAQVVEWAYTFTFLLDSYFDPNIWIC